MRAPAPPPWLVPAILAPLDGVGHPTWRALMAERGGIGLLCTEFVHVGDAPVRAAALARRVVKAAGLPLSVQLLGSNPERLAEAAAALGAAGADVVDLNLGCPAGVVVRRGEGAALLRDPIRLEALVRRVREAVPGRLSVKMRSGFGTTDLVEEIAERLQAAGIDFLTIHPRRREDYFDGVADWRIIRRLAGRLRIPVVGNGDCWSARDALRMLEATGCAAVMIGRGAIRNPWLFAQLEALRTGRPVPAPDGAAVVDHLATVIDRYREALHADHLVMARMKALVRYLGRSLPDGMRFRQLAFKARTTDALLEVANAHLGRLKASDLDLGGEGRSRFERSASAAP